MKDRLIRFFRIFVFELLVLASGMYNVGKKIGEGKGDILDLLFWLVLLIGAVTYFSIEFNRILKDVPDEEDTIQIIEESKEEVKEENKDE